MADCGFGDSDSCVTQAGFEFLNAGNTTMQAPELCTGFVVSLFCFETESYYIVLAGLEFWVCVDQDGLRSDLLVSNSQVLGSKA